ncbi:MAG: protein kinase [Myxococcales bacterium]|nr:protein kinase [Myxococcales bacterium]
MSAPRLSAGGVIGGKYSVRNILGDGGAVITYHCTSQTGQEVAVKLYDPAVASHQTVMKALEQAYAATNALPANSAAPIIDAGYDQATLAPFSVTELLRLPSLAAQQRRLAPEEVVALLKGLARSLDLAHVRKVVHGAIKPTNVFVGPSSNPVVVTDFAANLAKAAVPTQEGFVSSAPWIAPEQAQSGAITPSADVFSTGLLCFFALCGRSYWRSCQGQAFDLAGWQEELRAARAPMSARAAELGVPLSPTLDIVLWKALSNDPAERFKSIGEFANVMEDSLRAQVGNAATMALPMVGDAPSPLPSNMKNPEREPPRAAPNPNLASGATLALSVDQLTGGYMPPDQQQGGMVQQGAMMGQGGMGQGGMQHGGYAGASMSQQGMMAVQAPGGYAGASMSQQGMPAMAVPPYGAYGQPGRDQGYPPPPGPNGMLTSLGSAPPKSSKAVPIVIGFTAVALLGTAGTVLALKWKDLNAASGDGPVAVSGAPSASAAPTTEPKPTATQAPTPPPITTTSASAAAPATIEVKIVCQPVACDEVKVDGKVIEAKDLKDLKLAPGKYPVDVSKSGYVAQSGDLEVKEGSGPVTKTFTLAKEAVAAPDNTGSKTPVTPNTGGGGKKPPPCKKGGFIKCK